MCLLFLKETRAHLSTAHRLAFDEKPIAWDQLLGELSLWGWAMSFFKKTGTKPSAPECWGSWQRMPSVEGCLGTLWLWNFYIGIKHCCWPQTSPGSAISWRMLPPREGTAVPVGVSLAHRLFLIFHKLDIALSWLRSVIIVELSF